MRVSNVMKTVIRSIAAAEILSNPLIPCRPFRVLCHRQLICGNLTISSKIAGDSLSSSNYLLSFLQCAQEVFILSIVAFAMVVCPGFLTLLLPDSPDSVPSGSCFTRIADDCPSFL